LRAIPSDHPGRSKKENDMKKLVLLGDSIRLIGYGGRLAELLSDEYEVWQPDDNCRWADYTYRMLSDKEAEIRGADVIHWNNGHWDICDLFGDGSFTSIDNYVRAMCRVAKRLLTVTDKVIFSTTTPVKPALSYENNEIIARYNAAVVPALSELGVIINDLNAVILPDIEGCICDDNIHLSDKGIEACANQLCALIRDVGK
jgi:hypothetical protein